MDIFASPVLVGIGNILESGLEVGGIRVDSAVFQRKMGDRFSTRHMERDRRDVVGPFAFDPASGPLHFLDDAIVRFKEVGIEMQSQAVSTIEDMAYGVASFLSINAIVRGMNLPEICGLYTGSMLQVADRSRKGGIVIDVMAKEDASRIRKLVLSGLRIIEKSVL